MSIKSSLLEAAAMVVLASQGDNIYNYGYSPSGNNKKQSTLTTKQKKARKVKNKIASKSRSKNRKH